MRNTFIGGLGIALASMSAALTAQAIAGDTCSVETEYQIITLTDLTQKTIADFFADGAEHFVLECTEGMILPLNLSFKGEFLALDIDGASCMIKVLQTCYIKSVDGTLLFSSDVHDWKTFQEFFTGMMSVSLNVVEGDVAVGLCIELNSRQGVEKYNDLLNKP